MNNRYGPGRPARNNTKRLPKIIAAVLVLALAGGAAYYFLWHKKPVTAPVASTPELTYSQQQSIDVNTVGGAIGQYTLANSVLPTHLSANASTLVMCNATCDPTTSQISQLVVYQARNVQIRSYVAGMLVSSKDDMLLVPGATCKDKTALGDPTSKRNSMVILYATDASTGLSQHCVKL